MSGSTGVRCRHAFESAVVHANGEVVCSIIDGRGDYVLGNVHDQSIHEILAGPRARRLREIVLSTRDSYCRAIGKHCPLKTLPVAPGEEVPARLRYLAIEPTTACDLRCLSCPVRDFSGDVGWRDALRDGGPRFALWDGARRAKQHAADAARRVLPRLRSLTADGQTRAGALLLRGRTPPSRRGTLPLPVLNRVLSEAAPGLERIDMFSYGEPFLYRHLVEALRHARDVAPGTAIALSTDGMQVSAAAEEAIVAGELLDWIIFSVDGSDAESYRRYRIRGEFEVAFGNLLRFHRRAQGTRVNVVWQYVVFEWNDADDQLRHAIRLAEEHGLRLQFDFAHSWGRSRRRADDVRYLAPYLRPFTSLPGEARREGW